VAPELPLEQREDEAQSLALDTGPLTAPAFIAGRTRLRLASDRPQAQVAVRLFARDPDGWVKRISYGILNLSQGAGHAMPLPMTPHRFEEVKVEVNAISQTILDGYGLGIAVSTS
jgi:predicted acyl esterase